MAAIPAHLKISERLGVLSIDLAADHFAATAFLGKPEILLNQGDTESQWNQMYSQMEDDTYLSQIDRSNLHTQRDNLKRWLALSITEIQNKAIRTNPNLEQEQLQEQAQEIRDLLKPRGRGRPALSEEQKELRRVESRKGDATPGPQLGRGRGRPPKTDEQKAEDAARRASDPSLPKLGRPSTLTEKEKAAHKIKATAPTKPRRRIVPPVQAIETAAAREAEKVFQENLTGTEYEGMSQLQFRVAKRSERIVAAREEVEQPDVITTMTEVLGDDVIIDLEEIEEVEEVEDVVADYIKQQQEDDDYLSFIVRTVDPAY